MDVRGSIEVHRGVREASESLRAAHAGAHVIKEEAEPMEVVGAAQLGRRQAGAPWARGHALVAPVISDAR